MKNKKVTEKQNKLLAYIYNSLKNDGYPPSFNDLKDHFKVTSNQTIIDHLTSLEKKELITRESKSARGIKITPLGYKTLKLKPIAPFFGTSYAGTFTQTFELQGAWQELSKEIKQLKNEVYLIKVSGDSMINAQIDDGDMLLVQTQQEFSSGDIVVAQTNQGTTVKRFIRQNKPPFIFLKPENPKYQHISFTDDISMQGKVIGKYKSGNIEPLTQRRFL